MICTQVSNTILQFCILLLVNAMLIEGKPKTNLCSQKFDTAFECCNVIAQSVIYEA